MEATCLGNFHEPWKKIMAVSRVSTISFDIKFIFIFYVQKLPLPWNGILEYCMSVCVSLFLLHHGKCFSVERRHSKRYDHAICLFG